MESERLAEDIDAEKDCPDGLKNLFLQLSEYPVKYHHQAMQDAPRAGERPVRTMPFDNKNDMVFRYVKNRPFQLPPSGI